MSWGQWVEEKELREGGSGEIPLQIEQVKRH